MTSAKLVLGGVQARAESGHRFPVRRPSRRQAGDHGLTLGDRGALAYGRGMGERLFFKEVAAEAS